MTLHEYLASLRKHWIIIVILTMLGALTGFAYAQMQPVEYQSDASVIIKPARADNSSELVQGSNYVQNLVQTYAVVATSPQVLDLVIRQLNLDTTAQALAKTMTVDNPLNTVILDIAVLNTDPVLAKRIADATAAQLAVTVSSLSPQNADDQPAVTVSTIAPAQLPTEPVSPNTRLLVLLFAFAGLAIGVLYALLRTLFATRLTSHTDVAAVTDTPILGDVASLSGRPLPVAVRTEPAGYLAESIRGLLAGLRFANVDGATKVLLLTSANSGEGKSSVSTSTALIMAEQGYSVLLIDADLRRASVGTLTQLESSVGLTTVLLGDVSLERAAQRWGDTGVDVLTSGMIPPNPGQLLASEQLAATIAEARTRYDYVIIDSAPVLPVSDTMWLAPVADGIALLVRARKTKREDLARTMAALESTRTPLLGIIFNGARRVDNNPYYTATNPRKRRDFMRRLTPRGVDAVPAAD